MDDSEATSLEQIRAFLAGSGEVRFIGQRREEVYAWTEKTLMRHRYDGLSRPEKGLLRRYIAQMLEAVGEGTKMADHFSPKVRPRLSLLRDRLRTVLAVKGSLHRAQQRRALDGLRAVP